MKEYKCVLIIDNELPIGIIANTAAVLGVSLGKKIDGMIGEDYVGIAIYGPKKLVNKYTGSMGLLR